MAKAVFHQDFNYSSRKRNVGWGIKASDEPQALPEEVIAAGVAAGVATRISPRKAKTAKKGQEAGAN
ncbi:MAG: hypothetical protein CSA68_07445 [Rhodobacterales bacterium]|nr:MAG: hypothetical protein CSA68_07445 [Rhodobacterales bacterium]